jgi:hypothetical protein
MITIQTTVKCNTATHKSRLKAIEDFQTTLSVIPPDKSAKLSNHDPQHGYNPTLGLFLSEKDTIQ